MRKKYTRQNVRNLVCMTVFMFIMGHHENSLAKTNEEGNIPQYSRQLTSVISFEGTATGGTLGLVHEESGNTALVTTYVGEPSDSVIRKLDHDICFDDVFPIGFSDGDINDRSMIYDNKLILPFRRGCFFRVGNERGFDPPDIPESLTCNYDNVWKRYSVKWGTPEEISLCISQNDSEKWKPYYDGPYITYILYYKMTDSAKNIIYGALTKKSNSPIDKKYLSHGITRLLIYPWKCETPGFPINILLGERFQESYIEYPTGTAIFPCWTQWNVPEERANPSLLFSLEENRIPFDDDRLAKEEIQRRYFQKITVPKEASEGGIWRKYLGLERKHKYAFSVTLNTLDESAQSPSSQTDRNSQWFLDVCAAPSCIFESETPSPEQFVENDNEQTRILRYDQDATTSGKWVTRTTGDKGNGSCIGDIALPVNCDSITVWVRCGGCIPNGVGIVTFRLTDLGEN